MLDLHPFPAARRALLLGALLAGTAAQAAPTSPRLDTAALDRFMTSTMRDYDVPGVGLAIVQNGQIVYTRGYGVRDVTTRRPVDRDTQFAVGSVTKSFTALGIMQLVDRGLVRLDTPVIHYLPEFRMQNPESTRTVTVRNLLTHTTGLVRDDTGFFDPNYTLAQTLRDIARTRVVAKPGQLHIYSNANAILAGAIIERVTGQSWEAYTRERILKPLGMSKTSFTQAAMRGTGNFATPNTMDVLRGLSPTPFYVLGSRAPAGAINSSPAELARYVQFQLGNGRLGSGAPLLSAQSLKAMHTPFIGSEAASLGSSVLAVARQVAKQKHVQLPSAPLSDPGYAFFWSTEAFQGQRVVEHGGDTNGFTANISLIPDAKSGVVVLADSEHADLFIEAVRWHVMQGLLGTQPPVDTNAALNSYLRVIGQDNATRRANLQAARRYRPRSDELQALTGTYAGVGGGGPVQVRQSGPRFLKIRASLQGITYDVTLVPMGGGRYIGTSQPLVGGLFSFKRQGGQELVVMNSPLGDVPVGQRPVR